MSTISDTRTIWGVVTRHGGLVVTFRAFFDETEAQPQHGRTALTGVAACIFDNRGYETFSAEWGPRIASLEKPFHMASVYGYGRGEFAAPPWNNDSRKRFWTDLGNLIVRTHQAAVVCFITQDDYDSFMRTNPATAALVGNPYTLCLLFCSFLVGDYAKSKGEDVFYSFEAGGPKMNEASKFIKSAMENETAKNHLRVRGWSFVQKVNEPTLCAADYLAWGWQRAYQGQEEWHEVIEIIRADKNHPLYISQLNAGRIFKQALFNKFYGLSGL